MRHAHRTREGSDGDTGQASQLVQGSGDEAHSSDQEEGKGHEASGAEEQAVAARDDEGPVLVVVHLCIVCDRCESLNP